MPTDGLEGPSQALPPARRRAPIVQLAAGEPNLTPASIVVSAGGAIGIFGAAYCTSTGSPPTGLAVGVASVLFMALGAQFFVEGAPPTKIYRKGEEPEEASQPAV